LGFEGTGVAILGRLSTDGAKVDVLVDGQHQAWLADAYVPERTHDVVLWHRTDLKPGRHTVRLVTRADADPRSRGRRVTVREALVYRRSRALLTHANSKHGNNQQSQCWQYSSAGASSNERSAKISIHD
jgi:hypothetical protein